MIESYENAFQIAVLAICIIISSCRAVIYRSRSWTLLTLFFSSWELGDINWLVYLIFIGETPRISVVSDLSWYASFIFLYMLLRKTSPPEELEDTGLLPWLGTAFAVGMAVFFMFRGEILSNLAYAGLMGLLLYATIRRLMLKDRAGQSRLLSALILVYCLLEYCLWTASCFWNDAAVFQTYYVFDLMLTVSFPFFILATGKAVTE